MPWVYHRVIWKHDQFAMQRVIQHASKIRRGVSTGS